MNDEEIKNEIKNSITFDELRARWDARDKWRAEHYVQNFFISSWEIIKWRIPGRLKDWRYEVKYAWQRVFRGYDDVMLFSTYSEITDIMLPVLKWQRHHRMGSPAMVGCDDVNCDHGDKCDVDTHERWNVILDKMIAGFQALKDEDEVHILDANGQYDREASDIERKRLTAIWEEGSALFIKYFRCLWD